MKAMVTNIIHTNFVYYNKENYFNKCDLKDRFIKNIDPLSDYSLNNFYNCKSSINNLQSLKKWSVVNRYVHSFKIDRVF